MEILREIAIRGTVSAAANALHLTPSAVSQHMKAFQREVGVQLLEHVGRNVALTDAGVLLVDHAEAIAVVLERAKVDLEAVRQHQKGTLTIGAFPTSGKELIPNALRRFLETHPGVRVQITELDPEQSLPRLRMGELDLALAYECDLVPITETKIEQQTLFHEPMLVVHHGSVKTRQGSLAAFADSPWIAPPVNTMIHDFTVKACEAAGFRPNLSSIWTDFAVIQSLAAQGLGVAFVPRLALSDGQLACDLQSRDVGLRRRVFAAWRRGRTRDSLQAAFLAALQVSVGELGLGGTS